MERLKEKKNYLNEQLTAYNNYVKACLEQSLAVKKKSLPSSSKPGSVKKKKEEKKAVQKFSCAQLIKKGVIVDQ